MTGTEGVFPKIDGDDYYSSEVNGLTVPNLVGELAYTLLSDTGTFTNGVDIGADNFTVAAGVNATVDTGNTDAQHDATNGKYRLTNANSEVNDTAGTTAGNDGSSNRDGVRITFEDDVELVNVTKFAGCNATHCYMLTEPGVLIEKVAFVGNDATFTLRKDFANGDEVRFEADNEGGGYTRHWNAETMPTTFTNTTWESASRSGADIGVETPFNIEFINTKDLGNYNTGEVVETNEVIDCLTAPDVIYVYTKSTLPTDTTITVDVSDDGGTTFDITGAAIDSPIDVSALTGSSIAVRFNLATTDNSATPIIFGYTVCVVHKT